MPSRPTLTIPQPCHENWQAMTPAAQGRHCAACSKVVVDFSRMSDAEVLGYLGQAMGTTCGRFRTEQLQRPLVAPMGPSSWWQRGLLALLGLLGVGALGAPAAQAQHLERTQQSITMGFVAVPRRAELPSFPLPRVVQGRVLDQATGQGLPGVTVLLKGTSTGISTNPDGSFELHIPATESHYQTLIFSSIGFVSEERLVSGNQYQEVVLRHDESASVMGVVVSSYAVRKPWPWHPRAMWYQLRSAFRQ